MGQLGIIVVYVVALGALMYFFAIKPQKKQQKEQQQLMDSMEIGDYVLTTSGFYGVILDITEDVKKIKCPTLIVWGTYDEAVPLEDAYELEKLIKGSGVVVYEGCSHYAYLERLGQTINVINSFLESR